MISQTYNGKKRWKYIHFCDFFDEVVVVDPAKVVLALMVARSSASCSSSTATTRAPARRRSRACSTRASSGCCSEPSPSSSRGQCRSRPSPPSRRRTRRAGGQGWRLGWLAQMEGCVHITSFGPSVTTPCRAHLAPHQITRPAGTVQHGEEILSHSSAPEE